MEVIVGHAKLIGTPNWVGGELTGSVQAMTLCAATIRQAARELGITLPDNLRVTIIDATTTGYSLFVGTGGRYAPPHRLIPYHRITIEVWARATVDGLKNTARHEVYHLWEYVAREQYNTGPRWYDEDAAGEFAARQIE